MLIPSHFQVRFLGFVLLILKSGRRSNFSIVSPSNPPDGPATVTWLAKMSNKTLQTILTINAPAIMKEREVIFFYAGKILYWVVLGVFHRDLDFFYLHEKPL